MSYNCTNSWVYSGDPGNPPETESDNQVVCRPCLGEFDREDDADDLHEVFGEIVCDECIKRCDQCGEELTDKAFPPKLVDNVWREGPIAVRFRHYATGKLSQPHCTKCAGDVVLARLLNVPEYSFDSDECAKLALEHTLDWKGALPSSPQSLYIQQIKPEVSRAR